MKSNEIISKIESKLDLCRQGFSSFYFTVEDLSGETVQIRVSNHSANRQNFTYKTLLFITEKTEQRKSAYNYTSNEWVIDKDGISDTSQTIDEILDWEEVI